MFAIETLLSLVFNGSLDDVSGDSSLSMPDCSGGVRISWNHSKFRAGDTDHQQQPVIGTKNPGAILLTFRTRVYIWTSGTAEPYATLQTKDCLSGS